MDAFDWLVVMGGPMSVSDEDVYPWLSVEKRFLERALGAGKRVVGVCLGSQLLAEVLGGRVYRNRHKEIGWHPVQRGRDEDRSRAGSVLPAEFVAFHWHGDAFDLPPGALHLASSECTGNQAFECGTALGLLCHLEVSAESATAMVGRCANDIGEGPYMQTSAEILAAPPARYVELERHLAVLLDRLVD